MKRERNKSLLSEVQSLISDIEKQNETGSYEFLLKVLNDLLTQLKKEDNPNLQSCSSAIYRITTDDASFERSPIGQRLLHLVTLLHA
jgi:hypothetical protein